MGHDPGPNPRLYGRQIYTPPPRWKIRKRPFSHQNVSGAKTAPRGGGVYILRAFKRGNYIHHHRPENLNMPNIIGNPRESRIPLGALVVYRDPFRRFRGRAHGSPDGVAVARG